MQPQYPTNPELQAKIELLCSTPEGTQALEDCMGEFHGTIGRFPTEQEMLEITNEIIVQVASMYDPTFADMANNKQKQLTTKGKIILTTCILAMVFFVSWVIKECNYQGIERRDSLGHSEFYLP